jgi:DNA-binding CsgD family transcriptional regulator
MVEHSVGQRSLVARVDVLVEDALGSRGASLVITGDAGTGKTHFLRHLRARALDDAITPVVTLTASCSATGRRPFGPWRTLLTQSRRTQRIPLVQSAPSHPMTPSTPREFADRLLASWASSATPVLVLLDDADHLDPLSAQVLDHLHDMVHGESLVMVLATRSDALTQRLAGRASDGGVSAPLHTASLEGLCLDDVVELLFRVDPSVADELRTAAAQRLIEECQGQPLSIMTRIRRHQRQVAPGDLVERIIAEPACRAMNAHGWIRSLIDELPAEDRVVLAQWMLAPSLTRAEFCDATATPRHALEHALAAAFHLGLVESSTLTPDELPLTLREVLTGSLAPSARAAAHVGLGRYLIEHQPESLIEAAHHLEGAGGLVSVDELADALERAGVMASQAADHHEADRLLRLADEVAPSTQGRARRLMRRSLARRGMGSLDMAHELAHRAAHLARRTGDADLFAEAAVALTIPSDWRVGDEDTQAMLAEALVSNPSPQWRVQVQSALTLQRFQLPRSADDRHRWSWQFRPDVAGPLADSTLAEARQLDDDDALVAALLAWWSVHREPARLHERRHYSGEALSIAVRRRDTSAMVRAGVRVAVDELESANRDGFEHAAVVARWAADQTANPLLLWRAASLEATRACLDGDLEALHRVKAEVVRSGRQAEALGRDAVELVLDRHILTLSNGWSVIATMNPEHDWPLIHHPLGVAGAAEAFARAGRLDTARRLLSRLRWPADSHTSMLLVTTLAARAAVLCHDTVTAQAVLPLLVQYARHVAVDPEAIWVEGPVALTAAQTADLLGDHELAQHMMALTHELNRGLDCARTASTLAAQRRRGRRELVLPEREHAVLRLLADGLGNAEIAKVLNFSVSTIRRETTTLYQRLGVNNRASAVAKAHELGVL